MNRSICYLIVCIFHIGMIADDNFLGGYHQQSPANEYVQDVAHKVSRLLQKDYPKYIFVKVHKAANQIVAGTNYYLVLEFKTTKQRIIIKLFVYKTLGGKVSITKIHSMKKENIYIGGYTPQEVDAIEIEEVARKVTKLVQQQHPKLKFLSVREAANQIVAGTNYYLLIEFVEKNKSILWEIDAYKTLQNEVSITKSRQVLDDLQEIGTVITSMCAKARNLAISGTKKHCVVVAKYKNGYEAYFLNKPTHRYYLKNTTLTIPKAEVFLFVFEPNDRGYCIWKQKLKGDSADTATQIINYSIVSQDEYNMKLLKNSKCCAFTLIATTGEVSYKGCGEK